MESNDFRSRLKNQTTEVNPDAWKQMSEMLDAVSEKEQEEKTQRKWWLLLPLGALFLMATLFLMKTPSASIGTTVTVQQLKTTKDEAIMETTKELLSENSQSTLSPQTIDKTDEEQNLAKPDDRSPKAVSIQEVSIDESQESEKAKGEVAMPARSENSKFFIAKNREARIETNTIIPQGTHPDFTDLRTVLETTTAMATTQTVQSPVAMNKLNENNSTEQPQLTVFPFLDLVSLEQLQSDKMSSLIALDKNTEVVLPQMSQFSWAGGIGLSDFNGNTGYYLGLGLFWDLDKIIGLESNLYYAAAKKEIDRPNEYILERDRALKLQLWVRLHVLKNDKHNISLDLGPSIGYNTFERHWGTSTTNSSGMNRDFSGGLSYTYFLPSGNGIGIKGAFSRYDSGYAALKYFIKFK